VSAVRRHLFPLARHVFGHRAELPRDIVLAELRRHLRVAGDCEDGLDGQIGVVRQMPREVVGAELVFRVEAF